MGWVRFLVVLLVFALPALAADAPALDVVVAPRAGQAPRLNVLLIIADDLRTELGCYGVAAVKSPNIDRLAARGMRFDLAYCQYPVCNPSRASFLTGLRPDDTHVLSNGTAFRAKLPDVVTLPQCFRQNGYFSAGLGKVFHRGRSLEDLHPEMDDPKSYDELKYFLPTETGNKGDGRNISNGKLDWCRWQAAEGDDDDQPDGQITAEAVRLLEAHRDGGFFIAAGFHKPHDPFVAPKKYFDQYPLASLSLYSDPADASPLLPQAIPSDLLAVFKRFSEQDQREFKRAYYAGTSFTDAQIGKLIDTLDRLDLTKRTLVIMIGDNGYHLGERQWWNKNTLFEFSCRVPMIVLAPGMKAAGKVCQRPVEFVDIYPTAIDYAGLAAPHKLAGNTLRPLLDDPQAAWDKPALTQVQRGKIAGRSVRTEKWRYIEWDDGRAGVELYDMEKDYGNYHNLAGEAGYSQTMSQLKAMLKPRGT
jgi:iduronate 2-sulfatase